MLGWANAQAERLQNSTIPGAYADDADPMHWRAAAAIAAERDHYVATFRVPAPRHVMRTILIEAVVFKESFCSSDGIPRAENTVDAGRVVDQAIQRFALAGCERQSRQAVTERSKYLVEPGFVFVGMRANDPCSIGVLLQRSLLEAHHPLGLTVRVHLRSAESIADPLFVHQIEEVGLRCLAEEITREMRVLRRARDDLSRAHV